MCSRVAWVVGVAVWAGVFGSAWGRTHPAGQGAGAGAGHGAGVGQVGAMDALSVLMAGNERFVDGLAAGPNRDEARREETAEGGQRPVAAVLSCSDSRVPVEVVFDVGIGDVFVVRVAGSVAGGNERASLGYAVEHLGVPLIVVMGHTRCGAVGAAVEGGHVEGRLGELLAEIRPAVEEVRAAGVRAGSLATAATRAHVRRTVAAVSSEAGISAAVREGRVRVVGAMYDVQSGVVQWLGGESGALVGGAGAVTPARETPPARSALPSREVPRAREAAPAREPLPSREAPSARGHEDRQGGGDMDEGGNGAGVEAAEAATRPVSAAPKKDNWVLLGSMLAGATGLSFGVISMIGKRRG